MSFLKRRFLALALAVIVLILYWSIPRLYGVNTLDMFNVASFLANVATMLALIFLGLEVRNANRSQNLEGANRLFDLLDTAEARKARRAIYDAFLDKRELTKKELKYAEKIRADLNRVGIMVREGLFPKKIAFRMYSSIAIYCWTALENHIKEQREQRRQPSWVEDFEWFYNESKQYRKEKYPEEDSRLSRQR